MPDYVPEDRRNEDEPPLVTPPGRGLTRLEKLLLGMVVIFLVIAALAVIFALTNRVTLAEQAEGRRQAVGGVCAALKATMQGGEESIKASVLLPDDRLEEGPDGLAGTQDDVFVPGKLSRQLGSSYPSFPERVEAAEKAAVAYRRSLATSARREAKRLGIELVALGKDGSLDCDRFARAAKAG